MGIIDAVGKDTVLNLAEQVAEAVWFKYLKPMAGAYVESTENTWDNAAYESACGLIEDLLNNISSADGD